MYKINSIGWRLLFYPVTLHRIRPNYRDQRAKIQNWQRPVVNVNPRQVEKKDTRWGFLDSFWGAPSEYSRGKSSFGNGKHFKIFSIVTLTYCFQALSS